MAVKTTNVVRATPDFTPNEWKTGDVLTAEKLNNTDTGVRNAINGVKALEAATAEATALAAGQPPTASWDGSKWTSGIPAGAQGSQGPKGDTGAQGPKGDTGDAGPAGEKGDKGDTGDQGPAGANGKNGASFRVSTTALTDNQADIAAEALSPNNATIPYAIGDTVLDATNKKLYSITAVSGGVATIGASIATLP